MAEPTVTVEDRGPARVVTINRPRRRNAVDPDTARALGAAVKAFRDDDAARVLVLTGAGDAAFSAGADLKAWRRALRQGSEAGLLRGADGPLGFTRRVDVGKPTIAAIEGHCLAGGVEMAAWCDLRVCGAGATFGLLERRWNIPLIDGGTQRLPRIVGLGRALDLVLTGRAFGAEEALGMGFVSEVVPDGEALARALELAERLAAHPQDALLADRAALLAGVGLPLEAGLAREAESAGLFDDEDALARVDAAIARFEAGER